MGIHLDALISAMGGCGIAIGLARYAIAKSLADLDKLSSKVATISENVVALSVRLEKLAEHDITIREHTKKIAYFEGQEHLSRILQ